MEERKTEYALRRVTTKHVIPRKYNTFEEVAAMRESCEDPGRWEIVSRDVVVNYGEWKLVNSKNGGDK